MCACVRACACMPKQQVNSAGSQKTSSLAYYSHAVLALHHPHPIHRACLHVEPCGPSSLLSPRNIPCLGVSAFLSATA